MKNTQFYPTSKNLARLMETILHAQKYFYFQNAVSISENHSLHEHPVKLNEF